MKNIILDTDLYNEIDDQIALAYIYIKIKRCTKFRSSYNCTIYKG